MNEPNFNHEICKGCNIGERRAQYTAENNGRLIDSAARALNAINSVNMELATKHPKELLDAALADLNEDRLSSIESIENIIIRGTKRVVCPNAGTCATVPCLAQLVSAIS